MQGNGRGKKACWKKLFDGDPLTTTSQVVTGVVRSKRKLANVALGIHCW